MHRPPISPAPASAFVPGPANRSAAPPTVNAANVTLRQLEALVVVVGAGRVGAAAARLHMTQSAVSQAVQATTRHPHRPVGPAA